MSERVDSNIIIGASFKPNATETETINITITFDRTQDPAKPPLPTKAQIQQFAQDIKQAALALNLEPKMDITTTTKKVNA